jgi:DNA/RNA endonuclease YhcR with UshA esterase domain
MKHLLLFFCCILAFSSAMAQDTKTIKEILTLVPGADSSAIHGQIVKVRGIVTTNPKAWYQFHETRKRYAFWLHEKGQSGPETGVQVYMFNTDSADGIGVGDLQPGQEIELVGRVGYFTGSIQIVPDNKVRISTLSLGNSLPTPTVIEPSELNDASKKGQPSGQKWEGSWVTIRNVEVTEISNTATRGDFTVKGANSTIQIWDAAEPMRKSTNGFVKPSTRGIVYTSITGIVYDRNKAEFQIFPFDTSHLKSDAMSVPPRIQNVSRNPVCPKASDAVVVSADIDHSVPNVSIASATLRYAVGPTNKNYQSVAMTKGTGSTYTATIPAQAVGSFVHYYVEATDSNTNKFEHRVSGRFGSPYNYTVNDLGCTISDIQNVSAALFAQNSGTSQEETRYPTGYEGLTVTGVKGVVVSSAQDDNLGMVFIQEEGKTSWAGIMLRGGNLTGLTVGNRVTVTGTVGELNGTTLIDVTNISTEANSNIRLEATAIPLNILNNDTRNFGLEQYEGMLVMVAGASPTNKLKVVFIDTVSADNPNWSSDWRVGPNASEISQGLRIRTGRGFMFSMKNISWVNSLGSGSVLDSKIQRIIVTTNCEFDTVKGVLWYDWQRYCALPRTNADIIGASPVACAPTSRAKYFTSSNEINLYPNPTSSSFTVRSSIQFETVVVRDLTGRAVVSQTLVNGQTPTVSVDQLSSGIYTVELANENGLYTTKLLVP